MDLSRLMQQAQQMQRRMQEIEGQLAETMYEGNTGGEEGVTVVVSGRNEVQEVRIFEDLMNPDDREMLQDMILIAVNDALGKAAAEREEKLGGLTQGMKLPGM
ncbi:MAG: YbaB/EbfC family nucleoid-associated protein [Solobacterium sp.]|nr:YbaB/EbfC family nucleoid-associated protein [Solobacterium sp.]